MFGEFLWSPFPKKQRGQKVLQKVRENSEHFWEKDPGQKFDKFGA